ncbi:MAG: hypothetical protein ACJASP_001588 [Roseivirga sp.]|jgi:hypothetical protein
MNSLKQKIKVLQTTLIGLTNREITDADFQGFIAQAKAIATELRLAFHSKEEQNQLDSIIRFRTVDKSSFPERKFMQYLAIDRYKWLGSDWNKKGKYIYDLDQISLKLSGLIYKIEQAEQTP